MKEKWNAALPIILMLAFALTRWPGLWPDELKNFSAAYALAFCAGVYFPRHLAYWLPLGTLAVTDVLLNLFYYHTAPLNGYMLLNYPVYFALIWLGRQHSARMPWIRLVLGGILGALVFYLFTNTAAWIQNPGYPKTLAGWIQALSTGIPGYPPTWTFFRNTLLSGGLFTGLFAASMKLTAPSESKEEKKLAEAEEEPAEVAGDPEPEEAKA